MPATTNAYKRFKSLLGGSSRQIVTVVGVNTDGTSLVRMRNGKTLVVRGVSVPAQSKAWVVNGEIVSEAPDLPFYTISF